MNLSQILEKLNSLKNPEKIIFKEKKFWIISDNSLWIYHSDLKEIAKKIWKNDKLAIELFDTWIYEARILCSKIFNPKNITEKLMEKRVKTFENWEICDSFSMWLFSKSEFAIKKTLEWSLRENEFEKRASFSTFASFCMAWKDENNEVFENFLKIIEKESNDERIYVKKAINWALRNIWKRNIDLNKKTIEIAERVLWNKLEKSISNSKQWIFKNALKELNSNKIKILDYPRNIYRK